MSEYEIEMLLEEERRRKDAELYDGIFEPYYVGEEEEEEESIVPRYDLLIVGRLPGAYGRMTFKNVRFYDVLLMRRAAIRNGYDFEARCQPGELPDMEEDREKTNRAIVIRDGKSRIKLRVSNEEMFAFLIASCGNHYDFMTYTLED